MAQEILDALRREGFIDQDANTVGFELFNGVWLQAWAHDTPVRGDVVPGDGGVKCVVLYPKA